MFSNRHFVEQTYKFYPKEYSTIVKMYKLEPYVSTKVNLKLNIHRKKHISKKYKKCDNSHVNINIFNTILNVV